MINMLGHHLNKSVSVAIPAIFGDDTPHSCKLLGVEVPGLWLAGEDLGNALFPDLEESADKAVFVPFAQIGYLVESAPPPLRSPSPAEPSAGSRSTPHGTSRPKAARTRRR